MDNHHAHTIRLQSVWEPPPAAAGAWRRRFGRPSGIDATDRVVLVIQRPSLTAVTLNGVALPVPATDADRWTHDITAILTDRNDLALAPHAAVAGDQPAAIDAHGRASLPARWGVVSLEILTPPPADR